MIKMKSVELPQETLLHLKEKQDLIDNEMDYATQVITGKRLWDSKNRRHFQTVREKLEEMCVGKRRCNYCEDSVADEVEHIAPKDLYPQQVFVWSNYLFSCGPCNGPKNNKYAVFDNAGSIINVTRKRTDPVIPPIDGDPVLVNPRFEDPSEFLMLDLKTFLFVAIPTISIKNQERAKYTIEILGLNSRDYLIKARQEAFHTYIDSLELYVRLKHNGATQDELVHRQLELNSRHHPSVWHEMKRWREFYPDLDSSFRETPELL